MRMALVLIALSSLLLLAPVGGEEKDRCDLKTVEKAYYCAEHELLLASEVVSGKTYYVCEDCEEFADRAGACPSCDQAMVKKVSGKNVCPHCYAKPEPAEVCVKTYYFCPDCGHESLTAGKCADCESPWEKKVSHALVEYVCPECGDYSFQPGKCSEPDCERSGKPLVRTCSQAGTFPHVETPKAK
jgi:hypothetical protein